jgi:ATP-dependent phosphofructokinase / diphosphate-dependent phosphofructokinase
MNIGILTGGGDVPGLNPCIKAAVYRATDEGHEVLGIRRGWGGLLNYDPDDPTSAEEHIVHLTKSNTRTIDRTGGTYLHTSRTNPGKVKPAELPPFLKSLKPEAGEKTIDCTPHVLKVLAALKLEALIAIGGDDTLSYAVRLHKEQVPVICIPKTMDNDVFGTDYCIGFSIHSRAPDADRFARADSGSGTVRQVFGRDIAHFGVSGRSRPGHHFRN